ncbi:MAG: hypothetical protein V2J62_10085 [candidate division KSB1 bacterium]|jgi:exopolyphosphatase/guanosine-5'-triphosphate,3'-diphosphate pyrophosphatase|nr:hypothetical protein [candidate division KSB1 bacterium]
MAADRFISIDIGTNTIKYCIAERRHPDVLTIVEEGIENTRLGEGLQTYGILNPDAIERSMIALDAMLDHRSLRDYAGIFVVGTMALRMAKNAPAFLKRVRKSVGIDIEVLSGEQEAEISFKAIQSGMQNTGSALLIFDVGGGSTEITYAKDNRVISAESLNTGAVQLTEQFLISDPVLDTEYRHAVKSVSDTLGKVVFPYEIDTLIGIGGTVTTLAAMKMRLRAYNPHLIHGSTLSAPELNRLIKMIRNKRIEERKKITGLQPQRADIILAGALIVGEILAKSGKADFLISDHGLRHGILLHRLPGVRLSPA